MIKASKCESSINNATSAARMRQTDGMKRENQNGPESRSSLMSKYKFLESTLVEQLVIMYLLRVLDMLSARPDIPLTSQSII